MTVPRNEADAANMTREAIGALKGKEAARHRTAATPAGTDLSKQNVAKVRAAGKSSWTGNANQDAIFGGNAAAAGAPRTQRNDT